MFINLAAYIYLESSNLWNQEQRNDMIQDHVTEKDEIGYCGHCKKDTKIYVNRHSGQAYRDNSYTEYLCSVCRKDPHE